MGCVSSKNESRAKSLQGSLHRPLPRVAGLSLLEDLLLFNSYDQFAALVCKAKSLPPVIQTEKFPHSKVKGYEDWTSLNNSNSKPAVDFLRDIAFGKQSLEESNVSESDIVEPVYVINTWELMEGLDDEDICNVDSDSDSSSAGSDNFCPLKREICTPTTGNLEIFQQVELNDPSNKQRTQTVLDHSESVLPSKHFALHVQHQSIRVNDTNQGSSNVANSDVEPRIIGKFDIQDCLQNNFGQSAFIKHSETESRKLERDSSDKIAFETKMQRRSKASDLECIKAPSEDLSALTFKEWLYNGGQLHSPGINPPTLHACFESRDQCTCADTVFQLLGDAHRKEEHASLTMSINDGMLPEEKMNNHIRLSVSSDNGQRDRPVFDPEFLAAFEEALQHMAEEEENLLRQTEYG